MKKVAFGLFGIFVSGFGFLKYNHPDLCPDEFPLQQGIVEEGVFR